MDERRVIELLAGGGQLGCDGAEGVNPEVKEVLCALRPRQIDVGEWNIGGISAALVMEPLHDDSGGWRAYPADRAEVVAGIDPVVLVAAGSHDKHLLGEQEDVWPHVAIVAVAACLVGSVAEGVGAVVVYALVTVEDLGPFLLAVPDVYPVVPVAGVAGKRRAIRPVGVIFDLEFGELELVLLEPPVVGRRVLPGCDDSSVVRVLGVVSKVQRDVKVSPLVRRVHLGYDGQRAAEPLNVQLGGRRVGMAGCFEDRFRARREIDVVFPDAVDWIWPAHVWHRKAVVVDVEVVISGARLRQALPAAVIRDLPAVAVKPDVADDAGHPDIFTETQP